MDNARSFCFKYTQRIINVCARHVPFFDFPALERSIFVFESAASAFCAKPGKFYENMRARVSRRHFSNRDDDNGCHLLKHPRSLFAAAAVLYSCVYYTPKKKNVAIVTSFLYLSLFAYYVHSGRAMYKCNVRYISQRYNHFIDQKGKA